MGLRMNHGSPVHGMWPLSVALLLGPILLSTYMPVPGVQASDDGSDVFDQEARDMTPWWDAGHMYRMFFAVTAPSWWEEAPAGDRLGGVPIRAEVSSGTLLDAPYNRSSLVLVQYDTLGPGAKVLVHEPGSAHPYDAALPFKAAFAGDPASERLTLLWLLSEDDPASSFFCLYFNVRGGPSTEEVDVTAMTGPIDALDWIGPGMTFYGFDPGVEAYYPQDHNITIVGLYDGTTVTVEDVTRDPASPEKAGFRSNLSVGRMGKAVFQPPSGSYFRVTSDRPVVAHISAGRERGGGKTFYPSLDGGTVGRRFIFDAYPDVSWSDMAMTTHIYGIENASYRFYDVNGSLAASGNVKAGGFTNVPMGTGGVMDVRATGDIMIESAAINAIGAMPSVTGSPVGRTFYGSTQNFTGEALHVQPHADDVTLTVTDLTTGLVVIDDKRITGYQTFFDSKIGNKAIRLDATADISAAIGSTEFGSGIEAFGDDVTFVGGRGAMDFRAYAYRNPSPADGDEAYLGEAAPGIVFAFEDGTTVDIDGERRTLDAGGYATFVQGYHHITSDRPVSVMALGRDADDGDRHRWNDWGSYLAGHLPAAPVDFYGLQKARISFELRPGAGETAVGDVIRHAVEPGNATMFNIELANTGDIADDYAFTVTDTGQFTGLPNGSVPLPLPSRGTRAYAIGLTVPEGTPAGTIITTNISATSGTSGQGDSLVLEARVDPERFVDIEPVDVRYVDPGMSARFLLNVTNGGNDNDTVLFSAENADAGAGSCKDWKWSFDTDRLDLGFGKSGKGSMGLAVTAPEGALAGETCMLRARVTSANDSEAVDEALAMTITNQTYSIDAAFENGTASAWPGSRAVFSLEIWNLGNGDDPCAISLVDVGVPPVLTFEFLGTASPPVRGFATVAVVADVAGDAHAGIVPFRMMVRDTKGLEVFVNGTVDVRQAFAISLTVDRDEVWLEPGDGHDFALTLENIGNGKDSVSLSLDPSDGGTLSPAGPFLLEAGTSEAMVVHVEAGKGDVSVIWIKVHAMSEGNASSELLLTVYVSDAGKDTTIIPEPPCLLLVSLMTAGMITMFYTRMRMERRRG